jgi:hypothetical protein
MLADTSNRLHLPVTVLLERRMISRSFWTLPSWYLHTVAVGENLSAGISERAPGTKLGTTEKGDLFAWSGQIVTLYKDACERYWHALIGDQPLVYVVCKDNEGEHNDQSDELASISPVIVTIDYDDASAAVETDALVLSTGIPPELYRYMESFVLQHYKPSQFKKRQRRNWSGDSSSESPTDH